MSHKISMILLLCTLQGNVFTQRAEPQWKLVILPPKPIWQTWYSSVKDCHENHNGYSLGSRDPMFQNEGRIKSLIGNITVWTGSYKSSPIKTTPWMSILGCYTVSSFQGHNKKKRNKTMVFDCFYTCKTPPIAVGINSEYCFCFNNISWGSLDEINMDRCSVDVDGNIYGRSNDSAALYQLLPTRRTSANSNCGWTNYCSLSGFYDEYYNCYSKKKRYLCNNGEYFPSQSWITAQRHCVDRGSFLNIYTKYSDRYGNCYPYSYFRKYEEIKVITQETTYNSIEKAYCQTVRSSNRLVAAYLPCIYTLRNFAGLCKSYIQLPDVTTQHSAQQSISTFNNTAVPTTKNPSYNNSNGDQTSQTTGLTSDGSQTPAGRNKQDLAVWISVTLVVVILTTLSILVLFMFIRRRKNSQDGSKKKVAATNLTYEMKISTTMASELNINVQSEVGNNDNYHILEKRTDGETNDEYYVSGDSTYAHLNERRQPRGDNGNEYDVVHGRGIEDDTYAYDRINVPKRTQIYSEDVYNTLHVDKETGNYDLINHGNKYLDDNKSAYDTC